MDSVYLKKQHTCFAMLICVFRKIRNIRRASEVNINDKAKYFCHLYRTAVICNFAVLSYYCTYKKRFSFSFLDGSVLRTDGIV